MRMPRFSRLVLPLACLGLLVLPACGGGGSSRQLVQRTVVFVGDLTVSGFMVENVPGSVYTPNPSSTISIGDNGGNNPLRGFLRINLAGMPAGARVLQATLIMEQGPAVGMPYAQLGGLISMDHIEMGASLDGADWSGNSLGINFGTLSMDATTGTRSVDVSTEVALDVASSRSTSDFRFLFPQPTDTSADDDQALFVRPGQLNEPRIEVLIEVLE